MNDFKEALIRGEIPDFLPPQKYTLNLLKQKIDFIKIADVLNNIYYKPEIFYKIFLCFVKGNKKLLKLYLKKKEKEKTNENYENFVNRVKRYFKWSTREFNLNMMYLTNEIINLAKEKLGIIKEDEIRRFIEET